MRIAWTLIGAFALANPARAQLRHRDHDPAPFDHRRVSLRRALLKEKLKSCLA